MIQVVTMYNVSRMRNAMRFADGQEDDVLFCRTMRGIMQNIAHLCTRSKSKTWGKEGWKKVCSFGVSMRTALRNRSSSALLQMVVSRSTPVLGLYLPLSVYTKRG